MATIGFRAKVIMNTDFKLKNILVFCLGLYSCAAFAHDVPVHKAITINAAESAFDNSPAYTNFFNVVSSDVVMAAATNAMVLGSALEDNIDIKGDAGGARSLNHFYDPTKNPPIGLTDTGWPFSPTPLGRDSFSWASISNVTGINILVNENTTNIWSWQNARGYEWLGLTATNRSDRQAALTNMFRAVGQVMHLLQDTSQPQHVRNEQHLDQIPYLKMDLRSRSAIEDYGKNNVTNLNYAHGMLDWRGAGFTQLKDFWNRDFLRTGGRTALNADLSGGSSTLGLAEFTSGNFIGQRAVYAEFVPTNDIHYFAFPSLADTTQPNLQDGNLWGTATHGDVTLQNFKQGTRLYISKTNAGVQVTYHSALSYLIAEHPGKSSGLPILTIADNNVLSNYHNIFIPKAVQYSAGLLDYFFRGTMDASVIGFNTNSMQYTNLIVNTSGQDFSGGTFSIYQDDASGVRTLIAQTNFTGQTLANSNSMTMILPASTLQSTNLLLVYQGSIGGDSVDAGVAIAAKKFTIDRGPDWLQMAWDTAAFFGGSAASGSASTNTVQFSLMGTTANTSTAVAQVHGQLNYTGNGAICKIKINFGPSFNNNYFDVAIIQDSQTVFSINSTQMALGENDFTFPIVSGNNSVIQVGKYGAFSVMGYAGAGIPNLGVPAGSLSISFTLLNN